MTEATATATAIAPAAEKAGFWVRFFAYLIDAILLTVAGAVIGGITGMGSGMRPDGTVDASGSGLSLLLNLAYFVYFWSGAGGGQTPGMRVLKLRVIRTDGAPLTVTNAAIRFLGFVVATIALFIGLIWVAFDKDKQGWHDKIAGTYVVKAA